MARAGSAGSHPTGDGPTGSGVEAPGSLNAVVTSLEVVEREREVGLGNGGLEGTSVVVAEVAVDLLEEADGLLLSDRGVVREGGQRENDGSVRVGKGRAHAPNGVLVGGVVGLGGCQNDGEVIASRIGGGDLRDERGDVLRVALVVARDACIRDEEALIVGGDVFSKEDLQIIDKGLGQSGGVPCRGA